jgi:hypothetical protein
VESTLVLGLLAPRGELLERDRVPCKKHAPSSLKVLREESLACGERSLVSPGRREVTEQPTGFGELLQEGFSPTALFGRVVPIRVRLRSRGGHGGRLTSVQVVFLTLVEGVRDNRRRLRNLPRLMASGTLVLGRAAKQIVLGKRGLTWGRLVVERVPLTTILALTGRRARSPALLGSSCLGL